MLMPSQKIRSEGDSGIIVRVPCSDGFGGERKFAGGLMEGERVRVRKGRTAQHGPPLTFWERLHFLAWASPARLLRPTLKLSHLTSRRNRKDEVCVR